MKYCKLKSDFCDGNITREHPFARKLVGNNECYTYWLCKKHNNLFCKYDKELIKRYSLLIGLNNFNPQQLKISRNIKATGNRLDLYNSKSKISRRQFFNEESSFSGYNNDSIFYVHGGDGSGVEISELKDGRKKIKVEIDKLNKINLIRGYYKIALGLIDKMDTLSSKMGIDFVEDKNSNYIISVMELTKLNYKYKIFELISILHNNNSVMVYFKLYNHIISLNLSRPDELIPFNRQIPKFQIGSNDSKCEEYYFNKNCLLKIDGFENRIISSADRARYTLLKD